ncbi:uncharacterized protein LOC113238589 [Hyposmocoma kahamanoa]|uniref:uncharacterized protein LOC113238589 n=1 Tax=Hyposmocoma kahamanoa TaxID=1477025 RepID=UPI000E6D5F4C|nr:uncharacterized protein LOC113238589 [Hyposmocoma kahamanoa]
MSQWDNAGALAGIGFGALLLVLGLAAGIWWYCKRRHRSSSQGHVITLSPDPKHQHSVYTQQPSGYQQQQTGYSQQQTGYSQRQTGYPQVPMIQNDDVATVDLEISDAFSVPRVAPDRPAARPVGRAQNTATLNVSSALAPPALPSRAPSPFSPMRSPHELYD